MNCMKRIGYYCLMLLAFASCSRSPQPMEALYPVQGYTDLSQEKVKLSSLFAEYRLIPLETNDSSLIGGRGNKVLQRDSSFYIESENTILSFDNDGHFISRFDKRGSGPEDYIDISDFEDEFTERLLNIITEIFEPKIPFKPTEDKSICEYCPYHSLCGR